MDTGEVHHVSNHKCTFRIRTPPLHKKSHNHNRTAIHHQGPPQIVIKQSISTSKNPTSYTSCVHIPEKFDQLLQQNATMKNERYCRIVKIQRDSHSISVKDGPETKLICSEQNENEHEWIRRENCLNGQIYTFSKEFQSEKNEFNGNNY